ncbi:MAG: lactate utilization protein [Cellulosilyticaceae bacterium]
MNIKQAYYQNLAQTVIKNLNKRNIDGCYFESKEAARDYILNTIPDGSSISWGGSMTLVEAGVIEELYQKDTYTLLDRAKVAPGEVEKIYREAFGADYYLMSSNAITIDGKLVNVDGTGNRIASLIFGPKNVFILAGMNKVVATEADAINRVHNSAAPPNAVRLNKKTPCGITGACGDCLSPECMCMHTVITRNSRTPGRIKVILVGEPLGY